MYSFGVRGLGSSYSPLLMLPSMWRDLSLDEQYLSLGETVNPTDW